MTSPVQEIIDILDLETLELNLFRGRSPQNGWKRVFGGQVGYDRQITAFVFGVEADWESSTQKETSLASTPSATLTFFGAGTNGFGSDTCVFSTAASTSAGIVGSRSIASRMSSSWVT